MNSELRMTIEGPDVVERMIEEVRSRECLWMVGSDCYRNAFTREKAWDEISESVGMSIARCKSRWRSLRDQFRKELREDAEEARNGASGKRRKTWKWMNELDFLMPYALPRSNSTNTEKDFEIVLYDSDMDLTGATKPDENFFPRSSSSSRKRPSKALLQSSKKIDDIIQNLERESEPDDVRLFTDSLTATLRRLPLKKFQDAKVKIHQVLYDIEFD